MVLLWSIGTMMVFRAPRTASAAFVFRHHQVPIPRQQRQFFVTRSMARHNKKDSVDGNKIDNGKDTNQSRSANVEVSPTNHGTKPLTKLDDGRLWEKSVLQYLQKNKYKQPTPIQAHTIPLLLQGNDIMAAAQTGSGKTLMFALPVVQDILSHTTKGNGYNSRALILNPTRELAMQTKQVFDDALSRTGNSRTALAVGGLAPKRQAIRNADVVVGTPGRILQMMDERVLTFSGNGNKGSNTNEKLYVIIDEADRMLDLGFEPQLRRIARALQRHSGHRQTVLCSATFPTEVQRLAADFLKTDYFFVAAGRVGGMHNRIRQQLLWVSNDKQRQDTVIKQVQAFLKEKHNQQASSVIIFCNKKTDAEILGKALGRKCCVVTGDKTQKERNQSLQLFRNGKIPILVATDVAARGLHVENVGLVVQADAPRDVDTFVHRIGRTGRAGAKGRAVTLLDARSIGIAADLVDLLRDAKQNVPSWLLGMSYTIRARRWQEEQAIMAGSGSTSATTVTSKNEISANDEETDQSSSFSAQDFRKDAEAGSWGAGRDTSYHAFDDEAYGKLDEVSADALKQVSLESETNDDELIEADQLDNNNLDHELNRNKVEPFHPQSPSKALRARLRQQNGRDELGDTPDRPFYHSLSKGNDQILKFEYLGMFPFDQVKELLVSQNDIDRRSTEGMNGMPTLLMVAEKPSIAKALAEALSGPRGPRQVRGISRALPVYQFTTNAFLPENRNGKKTRCLVKVTSVVGHVFSLGFAEESGDNKNGFTDPSEFYSLPVVKKEEGSTGKLRVVGHLRAIAAEADHLVLWLDCDAEGENIAHEVIGVTRKAIEMRIARDLQDNPDSPPMVRIHRARFSAITKDALRDAFGRLEEPDAALSRSVDARQELDLRVGVSMTRLLNWRCIGIARQRFSPMTKLVSYGPCQTPALSFCVDRALEIEAFRPEAYQKVEVTCTLAGRSSIIFKPKWIPPDQKLSNSKHEHDSDSISEESSTFDIPLAKQTVKEVSHANTLKVVDVKEVIETKNAPLGLNTVALLTSASKAMGISPKQVMSVAEKLYSSGFISYPRTETTRYDPTGFDVRTMLREHQTHPEWGRTASYLIRTKYSKSGKPPLRGKDAGDHPPITPLKAATREEVGGGNQWRVYDFITRVFLGSLSDDLKYKRRIAELQVPTSAKSHAPKFELEQITVDSVGFAGACRWVLNDIGATSKSNDENQVIFREGMEFVVTGAESVSRETKPPRFLQEHELVQLMDHNRIGTDASMATHISNIVDRGYVILCDETGLPLRPPRPPRPGQPRPPRRYMVPTSLGMSLIDLFHDNANTKGMAHIDDSLALLAKPAIRAQMEEEVKQIANGTMSKEDCLNKNLSWFEAKYHELFAALSKERINQFGRSLCKTEESLMRWRRLGAFEPAKKSDRVVNPTRETRKARQKGPRQTKRFARSRQREKLF